MMGHGIPRLVMTAETAPQSSFYTGPALSDLFAATRSHARVCGNRCQVRMHRRKFAEAA
jgi:hypothetical protein